MMEFTNLVMDEGGIVGIPDLKKFILILAQFAPHLTEELWSRLKAEDPRRTESEQHWSVHQQPWPSYDLAKIIEETVQIVVQVNGKLRGTLTVVRDEDLNQKDIETLAKKNEKIQKFVSGKPIQKVIFIPGKLINFVVK
jgi:leucyl-tRNA synthetase